MEKLISRMFRKVSRKKRSLENRIRLPLRLRTVKLDEQMKNLCKYSVTGGGLPGNYRFLKRIYGLADTPTIFQELIDKTLEIRHPAWLDDIIILTKKT